MITGFSRRLQVPLCCAILFCALIACAAANSISFTDQWKDSTQSNSGSLKVVSQDTGSFAVSLTIPGLANLSVSALAGLKFTASFGDLSLPGDFTNSGSVSLNSITSTQTELDNNGHTVTVGTATISRNQNVATITGKVQNPLSAMPFPIFADQFIGSNGPVTSQKLFTLGLSGPITYNIQKIVYISGNASVSTNSQGANLYSVQVTGAANFTPPTVTFLAPAKNARLTDSSITAQIRATDAGAVNDVEFSVNNGNFQPGTDGASNTWSATMDLAAGTNFIRAYAIDTDGYFSTTNQIAVQRVVYAPMVLNLNGPGTVSTNYNGQSLQIQATYSITAKPDSGCTFVNWTDGDGNLLSTSASLRFGMASNLVLVANFKDTTRPTITITSPKSGGRITNSIFFGPFSNAFYIGPISITGTVKDNVAVSNVLFSLNGGPWSFAHVSIVSPVWDTILVPTPGTNTITVYALDNFGNSSLTNTVKFVYLLGANFNVQINGSGTISPDYNGALLALSNNYTIKAIPAKGFAFYYWSGSVPMSSNPVLNFYFSPCFALIANFRDIAPPFLTITSPKSGEKYSNATINVTGTANDNVAVSAIGVQINQGGWNSANLTGNTGWSLDHLPVVRGTNILQAYAMDDAGNFSATNTIKFIGVLPPDWAPTTLIGSTIQMISDSSNIYSASFNATTFSQVSFTTNSSGIGTYFYQQTTTNTAELQLTFASPPTLTNDIPPDVLLNFDSLNAGSYTNQTSSDTGTFSIITAANLLLSSLSNQTLILTNNLDTSTTTIKITTATRITLTESGSTNSDTYTALDASSVGALVVITDPLSGNTAYLLLTFATKTAGQYEINTFDNTGNFLENRSGSFTWH